MSVQNLHESPRIFTTKDQHDGYWYGKLAGWRVLS